MRTAYALSSLLACTLLASTAAETERQAERDAMVRVVREQGVKSSTVLAAMREVPRHAFVPAQVQFLAYRDSPLPIGYGQTISQPYIVGLMTELLEARATDRVLEIGTGSGYQAAVLSKLVLHVYSIEIVPALARQARQALAGLRVTNVTIRDGDGYRGWPDEAPFDRIILTASPPQIPQELVNQLKPGGRLVAPVDAQWGDQELVVVDKKQDGSLAKRSVIPVRFVPMVRPDRR